MHNTSIRIRGAREHNLRHVDVDIPQNRLVVITGLSGSGKSSLAFDTLFAEGQRRYLESLSTYTRQFLHQLQRPDVDLIENLPPTICVDQRIGGVGRRSTLATTTEIYDYLRVLYARAGQAHCTQCRQPVSSQSSRAIVDQILQLGERSKVMILAPVVRGKKGLHRAVFDKIVKDGFVRARVDGELIDATDPPHLKQSVTHDIDAVVDRIIIKDGIRSRLQESIDLATKHGGGTCLVSHQEGDLWHDRLYSTQFACPNCELSFPPLEPRTFSFNSPYGACRQCEGLGIVSIDDDGGMREGVCSECDGSRLEAFPRSVTLGGVAIHQWTAQNVAEAAETAGDLHRRSESELTLEGRQAAERILPDLIARLRFLRKVGLDYLTLDRATRTLSGGEFQRARLAACLGSGLIGVCYILDEPTIGLHARDSRRLLETLVELRDQGNTVVVVEHDIELMRAADYLIDLGPGAGREGGSVIATGTPEDVASQQESLTGMYLRNNRHAMEQGPRENHAAADHGSLVLSGARLHNLQEITAEIPLERFVCVTGVSGSGKSSLITHTLVPAVRRVLSERGTSKKPPQETHRSRKKKRSSPSPALRAEDRSKGCGPFEALGGVEPLERIIEVDQSPLGRTGRSCPATYSGAWDEIRKVFAKTREARLRGYSAGRFSFNSQQGRCAKCAGHGVLRIEMKFMPSMHVPCSVCRGLRFNRSTLAVRFRGKNPAEVLALRFDEAAEFFANFSKLHSLLKTFVEVGLGYLTLGQSSLTLSGGEAQRVKLATELGRESHQKTLFVMDEPTTGLHPADVERLIDLCRKLVGRGNTVIVVEHQLDVIAAADWVIDLGPDGGGGGGRIVAAGPPAHVAKCRLSHTGAALASR